MFYCEVNSMCKVTKISCKKQKFCLAKVQRVKLKLSLHLLPKVPLYVEVEYFFQYQNT